MRRLWKPLLGLVVVLAAFTISFGWPKQNGLQIDIDTSPRALAARQKTPWDLTKLQVMNRVIHQVNDDYVDPSRIDHQRMMLAGLDAIQRDIPPVLVHYQDGAETLKVQVNSEESEFAISDVSSPWELAGRFREVFAFLQEELKNEEDIELNEVEYTAVNGMLRTLDPHTILLPPPVFREMQTSTRGEFGGLGIVISIRDGHLTIIKPMPGTPAFKAGLERKDPDRENRGRVDAQHASSRGRRPSARQARLQSHHLHPPPEQSWQVGQSAPRGAHPGQDPHRLGRTSDASR